MDCWSNGVWVSVIPTIHRSINPTPHFSSILGAQQSKGHAIMISLYFLMFLSVMLGAGFAWLFIWAVKSNQFKDIEEPKYQMMRDDD
jgi:cbb3-type cytochrome oxidase maturation protein